MSDPVWDEGEEDPLYDFASPPKQVGAVVVSASGYSEVKRPPPLPPKVGGPPKVSSAEDPYDYNHLVGSPESRGIPKRPPKQPSTNIPGYTPLSPLNPSEKEKEKEKEKEIVQDPALIRQLEAQNALIAKLQQERDLAEQKVAKEREDMTRQLESERLRLEALRLETEREKSWREEKDRMIAQQHIMLTQQAALAAQVGKLTSEIEAQHESSQRSGVAQLQQQLDDLKKVQHQQQQQQQQQRRAHVQPGNNDGGNDDAEDGGYLYLEDRNGDYLTADELQPHYQAPQQQHHHQHHQQHQQHQQHVSRQTNPLQQQQATSRTHPSSPSPQQPMRSQQRSNNNNPTTTTTSGGEMGMGMGTSGRRPHRVSEHSSNGGGSPIPASPTRSIPSPASVGGGLSSGGGLSGGGGRSGTPRSHSSHTLTSQSPIGGGGAGLRAAFALDGTNNSSSSSDLALVHSLPGPVSAVTNRAIDAPAFLRANQTSASPIASSSGAVRTLDATPAQIKLGSPQQTLRSRSSAPNMFADPNYADSYYAPEPQSLSSMAATSSRGMPLPPIPNEPPVAPGSYLLCEGYLEKLRGVGQNRSRFFRLTTESFVYYTEEAGEVIATLLAMHIEYISDAGKTKLRVLSKRPFGTTDALETVLQTPTENVKLKWLEAYKQFEMAQRGPVPPPREGRLVIEGYLTKVKPLPATSHMRFFVLSEKRFGYFRDEAGELMASVPVNALSQILWHGDSKDFTIRSSTGFTVNGRNEVICLCPTLAARNRWINAFRQVVNPSIMQIVYQ